MVGERVCLYGSSIFFVLKNGAKSWTHTQPLWVYRIYMMQTYRPAAFRVRIWTLLCIVAPLFYGAPRILRVYVSNIQGVRNMFYCFAAAGQSLYSYIRVKVWMEEHCCCCRGWCCHYKTSGWNDERDYICTIWYRNMLNTARDCCLIRCWWLLDWM